MHRSLCLVLVLALAGIPSAGCLVDRDLAAEAPDSQVPQSDSQAPPDPVCGNALKEAAELCDDGNTVDGDGCSATCAFEGTCLVTLGGGSPVAVSVTSIALDGTLGTPRTVTVTGNHTDPFGESFTELDQLVTTCGPHVYVGAETSGTIARLDLDAQGGLVPGGTWSQPDLVSLRCDPATFRLQALSFHQATWAFQLVEYTLDASGNLASGMTLTLELPRQSPEPRPPLEECDGDVAMQKAALLGHPVTGETWILSSYFCMAVPRWFLTAWRLAPDPSGLPVVVEGPAQAAEMGTGIFGVAITDDGSRMALAGYSGDLFGWINLPDSGGLPSLDSVIYSDVSPGWRGNRSVAVGAGDEPFFLTGSTDDSAMLARGRFGATGPELLDETAIPGFIPRVLRVPGTDLVVTFGVDGQLATVDTADASLVVIDTVTIPGVEYGGSGVVVPCVP